MRMYRYYLVFALLCLTSLVTQAIPIDYSTTSISLWGDKDADGIYDDRDNCPDTYNPHQDDSDDDGIGDVCDSDDCGCDNEHQMIYVCQDGKTRRVYCSALSDDNTYCGPCEEKEPTCNECEADEDGDITLCIIKPTKMISVKGDCDDVASYFNADGTLKSDIECGQCACEMIGDTDSDGDGVCDSLDECPDNPLKTEAGMCGCDKYDTDGDWVCDEDDICPGGNDKYDSDGDGVPDFCDQCEGHDDNGDWDNDGIPDGCDACPDSATGDSDGDGVCDDEDICPGGDDKKDANGDGIPDDCETSKCLASGNSEFEWIQDVKINDWFNLTNDNGGYAEFSDPALMFFPGDSIKLWLTPGYVDNVAELSYAIFIDWNGDGDFDDEGERVYDTRSLRERGRDMVIPPYAKPGNICARFIVSYGRISSACDPCIDGEVEDYTLIIKGQSCDQTSESFDYPLDRSIQGLTGGEGWSTHWAAMVSGNAKSSILQGSLSASNIVTSGQKLGILTPANTNYMIRREFGLSSEDVWMSFTYLRGGQGSLDISLGANDEKISINSDNILMLGDMVGPIISSTSPSLVVLKISRSAGQHRISAWVNPSSTARLDASTASVGTDVTLSADITDVIFSFSGTDAVTSADHYLDEVRLSCSSDGIMNNSSTGTSVDPVGMQITVAPNPISLGANAGITLSNASFYTGTLRLFDMAGTMVLSQEAVSGLNIVPTSALQPGIYVLEIVTDGGSVTSQLVIQS